MRGPAPRNSGSVSYRPYPGVGSAVGEVFLQSASFEEAANALIDYDTARRVERIIAHAEEA